MKHWWAILLTLSSLGCAVGNQYNYRVSDMALPVKAVENGVVVLSVQDWRPYVQSGNKNPDFVGLQRGGFNNPFDVTTASGEPMTHDMAHAIADGLTENGYRVVNIEGVPERGELINTATEEGASRIVVLKVFDWKSDIFMAMTLHCDLRLSIFDSGGELLAENSMQFVKEIGGGLVGAGKNSEAMADEFAKRIGYLFNGKDVRTALSL